ncbi:hypothetical protein VPH35_053870 [Triticum aestivum]
MGNHLSRRPGRISDDARGGVATVLISCRCNLSLVCHRKASRHGVTVRHWNEETPPGAARIGPSGAGGRRKPARGSSRRKSGDPFGDLPEELLPMILSKLDTKQAAMTSVLSSAWRHAWKLSPRLTFDIFAISGDGYKYNPNKSCKGREEQQYRAFLGRRRHVQRFIDVVNAILHQRLGDPVEQLELRLDVDALAQVGHHLDDWVRFAVSSQAKGLVLHVPVTRFQAASYEQHVFPLQLLDAGGGMSSLQHVQLSHVSLKVPQSIGFLINLRWLGMYSAWVSTNDLNRVLSNCSSLEWLDLCMVYLKDGLKVDRPLSRLKYLRLAHCRVTEIEISAIKLTTFILETSRVPAQSIGFGVTSEHRMPTVSLTNVNLGEASELHSVHIHCYMLTLEHALGSLPNAFPMVQRLSLHTCIVPKLTWKPTNNPRFSRLRYLQMLFTITDQHADNILSIAWILEAAPFLEELDAEFISLYYKFAVQGCKLNLVVSLGLKCGLFSRNFIGTKSQVEVMVHIVENAPALEVLTVDPVRRHAAHIDQAKVAALSATRRLVKYLQLLQTTFQAAG